MNFASTEKMDAVLLLLVLLLWEDARSHLRPPISFFIEHFRERKWEANFGTRSWFTFCGWDGSFYRFLIEMNKFIWTFMIVSRSPMVLNGSWFIVGKVLVVVEGASSALDRNYSYRIERIWIGMRGIRFN